MQIFKIDKLKDQTTRLEDKVLTHKNYIRKLEKKLVEVVGQP